MRTGGNLLTPLTTTNRYLVFPKPQSAPERQLAGRSGIQHRYAGDSQRGTGTTGDRASQGLTGKKIPAWWPGLLLITN